MEKTIRFKAPKETFSGITENRKQKNKIVLRWKDVCIVLSLHIPLTPTSDFFKQLVGEWLECSLSDHETRVQISESLICQESDYLM